MVVAKKIFKTPNTWVKPLDFFADKNCIKLKYITSMCSYSTDNKNQIDIQPTKIKNKFIIREAQKKDIHELEKLFLLVCKKTFSKEAFERISIEDFRSSIANEKTFVGQNDDVIIGFVSFFTGNYRFIHNLFIHPDWQNVGLGKKLLKKALQDLKSPVELEILSDNNKARSFFEKQGWKEVAKHEDAVDPYVVYRYDIVDSLIINEDTQLLGENFNNE